MRPWIVAAALAGCVPESAEWPADLAPLATVSGDCPELEQPGVQTILSDGLERSVTLYFPRFWDPGMPALFFWHPLNGDASMMGSLLQMQDLADEHGVVVVMPQSLADEPYDWAFYADEGSHDAVLYDDLRSCLVQDMQVDPKRITSAGMSAGGLWTSWMTVHRADTLATSLVMSGGTGQVVYYASPAADIPVLVMWGGEYDTFELGSRTVDFAAQSVEMSEHLREDGHFVVECEHDMGHMIPFGDIGVLPNWLFAHTWGEPSPFESGDLSLLPEYCRIPSG